MGGPGSGSGKGTWTQERIEELRRLARTGLTMLQIAERMELTRGSVSSAIARYKIILLSAELARERATANKRGLEYLPTRAKVMTAPDPVPISMTAERSNEPEPEPEPEPSHEPDPEDLTAPEMPNGEGVTLLELDKDMCRWPIGDRYCGKPKVRGAYCAAHARIGYTTQHRRNQPYIPRRR